MDPRPLTPRPPWRGRRVVLGVTGGIAAYKSIQLARDLTRSGAEVDVILTGAAARFVGAMSFEGVTGRPVLDSLWSAEGSARHLRVAAEADLLVVAPATADFLARAAHGRADDLLGAVFLAVRAPVLLAPAMNDRMWEHPLTHRNARILEELDRHHLAGPARGPLGAGEEEGVGRMVEPEELFFRCGMLLGRDPIWAGRRVVVTAGPTREAIDPVRYVGNRSSGTMGFALAREAALRGASVTLVTGPSRLPDPFGVEVVRVESAREMLEAVRPRMTGADVAVYAAAVGDYRPSAPATEKLRKETQGARFEVRLERNPDIAVETRELRPEGCVAVGFALESEDLLQRAREKLDRKGFDLIVANPAGEEDSGFDVATNRVSLLDREGGVEEWPLLHKDEVARRVFDRVSERLSSPEEGARPGGPADEGAS